LCPLPHLYPPPPRGRGRILKTREGEVPPISFLSKRGRIKKGFA